MKRRIRKSMMFALSLTLLISYALLTCMMYRQNLERLKAEIRKEVNYIRVGVSVSGAECLKAFNAVDKKMRVTQIAKDGRVLYDTGGGGADMENHKGRKEVREALSEGEGEAVRLSQTKGVRMYYYALLLEDGSVLRAARETDSLKAAAKKGFPAMAFLGAAMLLFGGVLSAWQTKRLIKPINELDIERPLASVPYQELRPLLEAMDKRNKEKEETARIRKEFSANVSHELKTPLTSILGYAEIIKDGLAKQEDIPDFARRMYKEAKRLIALIEDIIKLSRLDEGETQAQYEQVNLYELCREVVSRLSAQSRRKRIQMTLEGENVTFCGIRPLLDEMIYNLCENAVKYNEEGGKVRIWAGNTLDGARVSISDNGIGIGKEHRERIFERFYRVDKSRSKESGGTGLGLSIVKNGARLHGIRVTLKSREGKGTRIELQFPKEEGEGG